MATLPQIDKRTEVTPELIREVTDKIVSGFNPRRVILFGSQARGDARADSDLDLIVELEGVTNRIHKAIEISSLFGLRMWPLDVLVFSTEEFERDSKIIGRLPSMIRDEMKILYERP
jgi:predicted nucleotidyltransferase